MVKLAKRMKKNTINVDIVAFGDIDADNTAKIEAFHENIKGSADGSNLAVIPPGPNLLSDSIVATPILAAEGMGGGSGGGQEGVGGDGGGGGGFEFGVDPNNDPELALALRMSMEEEERRRQREERERAEQEGKEKLEAVPEDAAAEGSSGEKNAGEGNNDKKDGGGEADKMDTA